jgi:hypothetical protein
MKVIAVDDDDDDGKEMWKNSLFLCYSILVA